jgi:hypothetical protein
MAAHTAGGRLIDLVVVCRPRTLPFRRPDPWRFPPWLVFGFMGFIIRSTRNMERLHSHTRAHLAGGCLDCFRRLQNLPFVFGAMLFRANILRCLVLT